MKIRLNVRGTYFDTYYIYNDHGQKIGIIEDHCRGVKKQYFVGWKLDNPIRGTGETETFDTKEEAMIYSVGQVVTEYL